MNVLFWTAICSLVLATTWTYIALAAPALHLVAWGGFTGWACHFAAGGGPVGFRKALASNVSGAVWALIALAVFRQVGGGSMAILAVLVGLISCAMVLQANASVTSFIPGAFLGAGTWFGATVGAGGDGSVVSLVNLMVVGSMVIGAVFGYANEVGGKKLFGAAVRETQVSAAKST